MATGENIGGTYGTGKIGAESNGKIADKLHNVVDQASDRASDIASKARTNLDSWIRDLGAMMERHPVRTVFIGVAAGYLLAKFRGRS